MPAAMRPDSSATFLLIGDHSQDGTWPRPARERGKPEGDRGSISSSIRAKVVYRAGPSRARA